MKRWRVAVIFLVVAGSAMAQAPEAPDLRKGTWQLKKLINKRPYETLQCLEPFADLLRQHDEQRSSGCQHSVKRVADDRWEIASRCSKVNEQGRRWESEALTTFTAVSETAYRMSVTGLTNTVPHQETIDARWLSPCRN